MDGKYWSSVMSYTSFGLQDSPESDRVNQSISDDLWLDELFDAEEPASTNSGSMQNSLHLAHEVGAFGGSSNQPQGPKIRDRWSVQEKKKVKKKVAFKTKSEVEKLDDGFKWRKYGKKMVKNSPNPRNYYRCSANGCPVKKRVERDSEDPRYVITTYEGTHNHETPFGF